MTDPLHPFDARPVASLAGVPQVSMPVVDERHAIGLGPLAPAGSDARLLALAESLAG